MSIKVEHLEKKYGEQLAVNDLSFQIDTGEVVGFLGPNGAGKSTTMKIITTYLPPSSGSVKVCGYDILDATMDVRKNIGYLPEHNPLYLDMYVKEQLSFAGASHGLKGKVLSQKVEEMIALCGLEKEKSKKIKALSKGYRQRIGLAQALIHDPGVLVLDEPTTGLDPNQIVEIRNIIKKMSGKKTIILSTHIMQEVQAICDRVIIIKDGKLIKDGKVDQVKGDGEKCIYVEFGSEIDLSIIANIEGVLKAVEVGRYKYELEVESEDVRSRIFKIASEKNLPLLQLHIKETSLEQVFQELTREVSKND